MDIQEYIKRKIIQDIIEMSDNISIILENAADNSITMKQEIQNFIDFSKEYDIDFWDILMKERTSYEIKRLKHLYSGKDITEFEDEPSDLEKIQQYQKKEGNKNNRKIKHGFVFISVNEAEKLYEKMGCIPSNFYYIVTGKTTFFVSNSQKEVLGNKTYWAAPTVEEYKNLMES